MHLVKKVLNLEEIKGFKPIFSKLPRGYKLDDFLFYDIETTGFDPEKSRYAMSGFLYFENNQWVVEQYLTMDRQDEKVVLQRTLDLIMDFKVLVTYNGDDFDIPYLLKKVDGQLSSEVTSKSLDLLPMVRKIKNERGFINCRLKTIEKHVGIQRNYFIEGDLLADAYNKTVEYVKGNEEYKQEYIDYMGYNVEDVVYLAQIMSDFAEDFFKDDNSDNEEQLELF